MASLDVRQVLLAPVVSEKSYNLIDENRYTFKVHKDAHRRRFARPSRSCSASTSSA